MISSFWKLKGLTWADTLATYVLWLLVTFLTDVWGLKFRTASLIVNVFGGLGAISPLVIHYIADTFNMGYYWMVLLTSSTYAIGLAILAISTIGVCKSGDDETAGCYSSITRKILFSTSLVFLVLGASLVRLTWLNDLIDEEGKQLSRLLKTLKVVLTIIVHLVGALAIPYINSWPLRFGIAAICMLVATIIFSTGRFGSSHASKERPVITVLRVLVASFLGTFDKTLTNSAEPNAGEDDRSIVRSSHLRCLDRATNYNLSNHNPELELNRWKHCTVEEVEEAKKTICGIPFCIAFFVLGIISSLGDTYFIEQAETMNRMIGNWDVPLQILELFRQLAKAVIAKSYSKIADKFYGNARSKSAGFHGILISSTFAALCCITAATMEVRRLDEVEKHMLHGTYNTVPLTMFWLVPQYLLLGGLDGIAEESIDLFFSDPAPNSYNQFMGRFAYGFYGFGTIGSILSVYLARHISAWGDDTSWFKDNLNDSRFDKYCWVMTGQSAGNFIFCLILYFLTDLRLAASTGREYLRRNRSVEACSKIEVGTTSTPQQQEGQANMDPQNTANTSEEEDPEEGFGEANDNYADV